VSAFPALPDADTIAAIATAPGRGAVAVLRVSGPDAFAIVARCVPASSAPRVATLATVRDPRTGESLDRALVTRFPAPRSYTGEDVVELATHGGLAVPAAVLAALVAAGARPAEPGEFTRRAVLRGRLDLAQAEAVGDLVDARTQAMRRAALVQLDGGLSRRVGALREALLHVEALLAYDIDFPEEDDGPVPRSRIAAAAAAARRGVEALLATAPAGAIARDGAVVVIAGPPNAGKSSLFNALAGEARALVTDVPGTTRDALEVVVEPAPIDGARAPWPLRLIDTAGLRATDDRVERLGIELSERWVRRAHAVLACGETVDDVVRTVVHVAALTEAPVLGVWTKSDERTARSGESRPSSLIADRSGPALLSVSAESGTGLHELLTATSDAIAARWSSPDPELPLVTRARQQHALEAARDELAAFETAWEAARLPAPVAAVHLRAAVGALESLIGAVDVEDVLDRLFASFCVGK
jgi:tRNA modification GTPase